MVFQYVKSLINPLSVHPDADKVVTREGITLQNLDLDDIVHINLGHPDPKNINRVQYGGIAKGVMSFYALLVTRNTGDIILNVNDHYKNISLALLPENYFPRYHHFILNKDTRDVRLFHEDEHRDEFKKWRDYASKAVHDHSG